MSNMRLTGLLAVALCLLVSTQGYVLTHPSLFEEMRAKGDVFMKWLEDNGGDMEVVKMDVDSKGYVLKFAGEFSPLSAYTLAVHEKTVPSLTYIHTETTIGRLRLKEVNTRVLMALWLMRERRYPNSFWKPWIDCLPEKPSATEFYPEEARKQLQGYLAMRADVLLEGIRKQYDQLFPRLNKEHPKVFHKSFTTWEDFLWAYVTVRHNSRILHLKVPGESFERKEPVIWPTLFAMRHDDAYLPRFARDYEGLPEHFHIHYTSGCGSNTSDPNSPDYKFCHTDDLLNYQVAPELDNTRALLAYGFTIPNNKWDSVMISLQGLELTDWQRDQFVEHDIDEDLEFPIRGIELPEELILVTQILAPGRDDGKVYLDLWDRDLAVEALRDQLIHHLENAYPTSLEQDRGLVSQVAPHMDNLGADALAKVGLMLDALEARMGEKRVLNEVITLLDNELPKSKRRVVSKGKDEL